MSCYWERFVVSTDGHFAGTEEGIRILAAWRVGNRLMSLTALPELGVRGLLQKILRQQPPSSSETLHAVLDKILLTHWMSRKNRWSMPSRHIARRTIIGAGRLGLLVLLAWFPCGMLTGRASGAQKPNGHKKQGKPVRVVSIRFGQFGGTGKGYTPELQVSDGQATLTETSTPIPQRQHTNLKVRADLSAKHWQEIQALVDRDELFALPDRTSCASCVDGLDEFVEVKFSDHAKKSVTYAEGSTPKQLEDLAVKLKALEEKLQNELPPGWYNPR
jgi:hypothetical protein